MKEETKPEQAKAIPLSPEEIIRATIDSLRAEVKSLEQGRLTTEGGNDNQGS